jgi:hypothetical protein
LTCGTCDVYFCGLCGTGGKHWTSEQAHAHVEECGKGIEGFHQGFVSTELWPRHHKLKQWRLCRDYLSKTDLPLSVKERLQADFPHP